MGLVDSLARPGGNVTGISSDAGSLAPRRVQLLRELLPKARRIGLIGDVNDPTVRLEHAALAALDPALGLTLVRADASDASEFDAAVERLLTQNVEAIFAEGSFSYNMLPVEQPRLFEFVVNRKTAKALGIAIPQIVLLQADRVIE